MNFTTLLCNSKCLSRKVTVYKFSYTRIKPDILCYRHNSEMEKELMKMHRESRSSKGEREKASNESRKKKKEHLARCNASFQPTTAGTTSAVVEPSGAVSFHFCG